MTIAPIVLSVQVKADPPRAFALFVSRMGDWFPRGKTVGKSPHVAITVEPQAGGRWFECDADGNETRWGTVLAWEPPSRLLLAWQLNCEWGYDPELQTEVELTFTAAEHGGTRITLEHRHLERFGADAAAHAERLGSGWPALLADFVAFAKNDP
jgi:uncharacterized protein YndB with AHSA1/START domain